MIPNHVFVSPRSDGFDDLPGFRACIPKVPGCVIILLDENKATAIAAMALQAILEEGIDPTSN